MSRLSVLCALIALSLSSCAGLGALKFESISNEGPTPDIVKPSAYSGYFKVELSSAKDIEKFLEKSGEGPLYPKARLCPVPGEKDIEVIALLADRGRISQRYEVYLVARYLGPHQPYSAGSLEPQIAYDLTDARRDVCIRFKAPKMAAAVWSDELRIPAAVFRRSESVE